MLISPKRVGLLAVVGAMLCLAQTARAQFQVAPGLANPNPYAAGATGANPYGAGFFNRGNPNPYTTGSPSGFNPYVGGASMSSTSNGVGSLGSYAGNPYLQPFTNYGAVGGTLIGASSVISASGQLQVQTQQARIVQQQAQRERIDTRRRVIEEWLWERNNLPTWTDEQERIQRISLRRMQNDPPITEIVSGQALNELLTDIQKHPGASGPDLTLNEDLLRKVNVSPAGRGVNLGVLKNNGVLSWPIGLRGGNFAREKQLLDQLATAAFNEASKGQVDAAVINQMSDAVDKMLGDLNTNIKEMAPNKYIEARRFLNDLKDASRGLERNDVANFFNNKYSARGRTVKELADNMRNEGLKFAPYSTGNEAAYVALHRLLAAYDTAINGVVADQRQP